MSFSSPFATPQQVLDLLVERPDTIILDVRGAGEIAATGKLMTAQPHAWYNIPCSPTDASEIERRAPSIFGSNYSTPIVVHYASGRRAAKAQQVLLDMGYQTVVNAGGWSHVAGLAVTRR